MISPTSSRQTSGCWAGGIGRTFGLLQAAQNLPTPDPQWTLAGIANFAVNPIDSHEIIISS